MGDLDDVCHDDRLIEAAARGECLDGDPAAGPLLALSRVADAAPLPRLDLDPGVFADPYRNRRYAVRSLAVALAAVATLSTSGVAAVVTGDPFRPAKAVWEQIQEHTRHRVHVQGQRPDSDSATVTGRPSASSDQADPARPAEPANPSGAVPAPSPDAPPKEPAGHEPSAREVARAPVRADAAGGPGRQGSAEPRRTPDAEQSGSRRAETRPEQDAAQDPAHGAGQPRPEERSGDSASEDDAGAGADRRREGPAYRTEPTPDDDATAPPDGPADGEDPDEGSQDRRSEDDDDIEVPFWGPERRHDEDASRADQPASDSDRRSESVEERAADASERAADASERAEGVAERARDGGRRLGRMGTSRPPSRLEQASPTPRETSTDREEVPWN